MIRLRPVHTGSRNRIPETGYFVAVSDDFIVKNGKFVSVFGNKIACFRIQSILFKGTSVDGPLVLCCSLDNVFVCPVRYGPWKQTFSLIAWRLAQDRERWKQLVETTFQPGPATTMINWTEYKITFDVRRLWTRLCRDLRTDPRQIWNIGSP